MIIKKKKNTNGIAHTHTKKTHKFSRTEFNLGDSVVVDFDFDSKGEGTNAHLDDFFFLLCVYVRCRYVKMSDRRRIKISQKNP